MMQHVWDNYDYTRNASWLSNQGYPLIKGVARFWLSQLQKDDFFKDTRALHKAILTWTRKNFARLHDYDPRVAEACLVDGITYDAANHRIVRTYLRWPGQRADHCVYLNIDPQPIPAENTRQTTRAPIKVRAAKGPRH